MQLLLKFVTSENVVTDVGHAVNATKAYGKVQLWVYALSTMALDDGDRSASLCS